MENNSINRRNFLKYTGLSGAGLVLGISNANAAVVTATAVVETGQALSLLTPYIIIEKTGKITIFNTKPEIGQGTFQSIPALIAEELGISSDQYEIKQTGGESKFGPMQMSGGSMSVRLNYNELRKVGAAAREMLITAAAKQWNVSEVECTAENAKVTHQPTGKTLTYGELVETAAKLEVPKNPTLKDPKDFKILGKPAKRQDIPLKVSGRAVFGIDAELPNMVYASVERCPVFGSKLKDFDKTATLKVTGVEQVVEVERVFGVYKTTGVAVVAKNYWAALKGRKALKVNWDYQGKENFNTADYTQYLRDLAKNEGLIDKSEGDFDKIFAESVQKVEAFYETPFVSHSTMEAMNCTAHWYENGNLEIWTSTQVSSDTVRDMMSRFGLKEENITLHTCFNGGGFGRRLAIDFIIEAVNLAKAIKKPVKLIWTREDDTQLGPFRPPTFSALKGALTTDGKLAAFQHKVIAPTILSFLNPAFDKTKVDETMVEGISHQAYEIPNMKNTFVYADIHVPLLWWRSVTSSTLAFSHECFIDELAHKAGKDPMTFRLEMLTKESDTKRVLQKLKEVSNWDRPLPKGKGRGVAQWSFFAGLAGQVIEVTKLSDNSVKIDKVYVVIDLGTVVNPDTVKAQMEGAVIMGITAATKNGITFANGRTVQSNFHDNPVLRINEAPKVEVHILAEGGATIKGVGEPGLPPVAPALANAIFAATGIRLKKMPFNLDNLGE
ncbi:xanthine dehydrogenase family protein molybdopterin-binding subunit [Runella sp. SP2]|uniref:xanthine dehydrogenase family protein molybdopterin-binding subunit n=1 Tax=Runella sp. SP2 TaxID=2268026 RepID=UPI000F08925A|nr:xanthine dehydrogenase family protein molybdopterin-binding subunit [Runella sp. SP2]AYQ32571.1 xanthine dehydrogenase family protein molybdopterin-binding subunit [Runella sp. SP2]